MNMATSDILARKAANDAGFDIEIDQAGVWRCFGISGSSLKVFVALAGDEVSVATSSSAVSAELANSASAGSASVGTGLVWVVRSLEDLRSLLRRIRLLDDSLPNRLLDQFQVEVGKVEKTEREAMVRQRVGQDLFRKGLMGYWEGRCAISGLAVPELLRASHAKPWKDCSDEERLDVHNGLLLAAHLDAAFDSGLITVLPDGLVAASSKLDTATRALLGVEHKPVVSGLKVAHASYLAWHREKVFVP